MCLTSEMLPCHKMGWDCSGLRSKKGKRKRRRLKRTIRGPLGVKASSLTLQSGKLSCIVVDGVVAFTKHTAPYFSPLVEAPLPWGSIQRRTYSIEIEDAPLPGRDFAEAIFEKQKGEVAALDSGGWNVGNVVEPRRR